MARLTTTMIALTALVAVAGCAPKRPKDLPPPPQGAQQPYQDPNAGQVGNAIVPGSRADFQRIAADLQRRLPDSIIERAMHRLPPAVFALEGVRIGNYLKARRQKLPQAADAYYLEMAREPNLGGSALADRFVVQRYPDSTTVRVFSSTRHTPTANDSLRFRRTYFTSETRSIVLDGLGGDDIFDVTTTDPSHTIDLQLYGGEGHNQLLRQGSDRRLKMYAQENSDLTAASRQQEPYLSRRRHTPAERK